MLQIKTIQQDIAALPPDAQQIIFDLVALLSKKFSTNPPKKPEAQTQDWSDLIGCITAEPDLSRNYKTYLSKELEQKYDHR